MNEIRIKTFLPDGTESGEMAIPIDNILTMGRLSYFCKMCKESDEKAGTKAIETIKAEIMARIAELKNHETGEYKSELCKKDGEKLEKKLLTVCPELKEQQRKLKIIKNQTYFRANIKDGNKYVSAHVGDKIQTPEGITAYMTKSGRNWYEVTEETTGGFLCRGTAKHCKEIMLNPEKMATAKNTIESGKCAEQMQLISSAKSGKVSIDEIKIENHGEYEKGMIEMFLSDIYADAKKQAETSGTETDEAERFEAIIERLGYFYNELYNNSDFSEKYERPATQAGDKAIKNYDSFIKYYVETRHDGLTSDREIAAFALALAEIGEISEIMPEKQKEQTRTEKIQEMLENGYISEYEAEHLRDQEESEPTTTNKEVSTMNENTNTAVQATEEATEKRYTAAEIQTATGFEPENVRISAHIWHDMDGTPYNVFRAAFVAGTSYKIPAKYTKSAAAEIIFTVVSNSGKSLKVNIYEKYNGKISEQMNKTKKLCPGSHGIWESYNPETNQFSGWQSEYPVEFIQIDCIDIKTVSRWTKDTALSVIDCIPLTAEQFDNWKQNPGTATTNPAQAARKTTEELDFTPVFYPVSESLARAHKNMISWSDYKPGTVTAEYQEAVKEAYELAKQSDDAEKSLYLADVYARRLARWYDDYNRNGAACPSVMISGAGNFPTRKKEKQNARFDTLMKQYNKIKQLLEKIEKPHGYGVEIRRDTITAEEFENILYFDTVINEEENRLQLVFDGKPEEAERNILKKNGFRWSPRFKAWQRQLTENAVCAVWNVVNDFDKLEEEENAEIQAETEAIKATVPENERTETVETTEAEQEAQPEEMPEESAQAEKECSEMREKFIADGWKNPRFEKIGENLFKMLSTGNVFKSNGEVYTYNIDTALTEIKYDAQPETSPTESPEHSAPETIPPQAETPTETTQTAETSTAGETEATSDWSGVKFEPIPGIPDPETVEEDTAEHAGKLTEALEKLDRMRKKLDNQKYISPENSRYYAGFLSAVCCIFGEVLYDTETGKHYLQAASETAAQPEETAQTAEENSVEPVKNTETATEPEQEEHAADETIKFEPGKIYYAIHITNSDYISAYRVISRTAKTIILENSSGERFRKRPTVTDGYINGKQCRCETVYPDGVYSMCLVLDATSKVNADTPKQAEQDYFMQQQERTAAAVSAARQRQIIQTTGGAKITMSINGAAQ